MRLQNKVAIVTGASRGIGRGIANEFLKQGAKVVYSDLAPAENLPAENAAFIACDVSNAGQVNNLIQQAKERFGGLDILVNNAGIYPFKPFLEISEAEWDKVISVNLRSIFLCSQAAAKIMSGGGKIISVSSIAAFIGFAGLTHYCASKGGINALTRAIALELAAKKINVNAIAPGQTMSEANLKRGEETDARSLRARLLKRRLLPEDLVGTVIYLSSSDSDMMTGQVLLVDGGTAFH